MTLNTEVSLSAEKVISFVAYHMDWQGGNPLINPPLNNPSNEARRIMGSNWSEKEQFHGELDLLKIVRFLNEGKVLGNKSDTKTSKTETEQTSLKTKGLLPTISALGKKILGR